MYRYKVLHLVSLAVVWSTCVHAKLSFTVQPPSFVVFAPGQTLMLNCQASDTIGRVVNINWKKDDTWLINPNNKPWQFLRNNSLYFPSISTQESGNYRCAASIPGTSEVITCDAKVQAAYTDAHFTSPSNQTKRVGDSSTYFTCVTGDSLPLATVYWEKDGQKLTGSKVVNLHFKSPTPNATLTSSSLAIQNVDFARAGFYCCVAVNSLVTSLVRKSNAGYLHVLPKIDKPHFGVHPSNQVAAENRPALLQCLILGVPTPTVTWSFNGKPLASAPARQILSNGSLYFHSVNRSFTGQYGCKGSNSAGSVDSTDVLFSVAFFDFQFFEQPDSQNVTMGTRVTLRCKPPNSYPVGITINWFKNYQPITASAGITITSSGSMVFTAIKKSDEGGYFCNGENKVLLASRSSRIATITVWVTPTFSRPPQDTAVIQYRQLALHCESTGFPVPSITWRKDDGVLNGSHVTLLANGSLIIQRTVVKDAGKYSCYATNVAGIAIANASVDVYVPPSVSSHPSDATCVLGQPITFQCSFHGNPTPRIEWYHGNVSTIRRVLSTPKYIMTGNTLKITSVSIDDEGTFICKGINVAGTVNATAFLNVQVPVSLDAGPVNITVNQSSPASFKCVASGDPKPNITWYKGRTLLQNGGRFIITGETLSITQTNATDAGEYQCHVTNGLATHVGKAHLVVQVIPTIISFNVPSFVHLGGNTVMTCQSNGIPDPQVTWYRDGNVVTGARVSLLVNGSLRIVGITRDDGGMYTCKAQNAAGMTTRNGKLTVQVPPSSPTQLSATPLSSTSIKLSWQPGFNGQTPITGYKVDIRKEGQISFTELESSVSGLELVERDLLPYTNYTFKVSARNVIGLGQGQDVFNITMEDAPSPPTNIVLTSLNSTAIQIKWSAPSQANGVIRRYEIIYQSLPSGSSMTKEILVTSSSSLLLIIPALKPFTEYMVKIRAATVLWGNYSTSVLQRTAETAPSEPPGDVQCHVVDSSAVMVTWKALPSGSTNGIIRAYRILYRATGPFHQTDVVMVTVNNQKRNYTIQRLKPWTFYNISVQAFTVYAGPGSRWKTVRTHEAAPTGPPNVTLTSPNDSSILVTMTPPPELLRNGIITGYNVSYKESNSVTYQHLFTSSRTVLLSNLDAYTEYGITVAAATKAGIGPRVKDIVIRAQEGVPNPVTKLKGEVSNHNQVIVTWSEPRPVTGVVLSYKVSYNTSDGDVSTLTTKETSIVIPDLTYNTTYHIWVIAVTSKGYGMAGKTIHITTSQRPILPPTTPIPTSAVTNATESTEETSIGGEKPGYYLSERDLIIISVCAAVLLLVLLVVIVYCGCIRTRREHHSDHKQARKTGAYGFDAHELRGVSPDRRPVLDVREETSVVSGDSFDDFSEFNSSITGMISEPTSDPLPHKTSSPSPPSSELTGTQAPTEPITKQSTDEQEQDKFRNPYVALKHRPAVGRLKNKKLSLASTDSLYDQPYSSVDELGTGFSSFTPPPPEDFRNDDSPSSNDTPTDPPQEFSNKLYNAVSDKPITETRTPSNQSQSPLTSEYAEPEVTFAPKQQHEDPGYVQIPEVESPPPPSRFLSDFKGVQNEGYDTDEELDNYLAEQPPLSPYQSNPATSSRSPTSSRSQSASPPSRDDVTPVYAVVDKTKKKSKNSAGDTEHDPVVVYDERTNL